MIEQNPKFDLSLNANSSKNLFNYQFAKNVTIDVFHV